jgi:hypothetical protein
MEIIGFGGYRQEMEIIGFGEMKEETEKEN